MAKCAPCTEADLFGLDISETITCGFYGRNGVWLGNRRVTRTTNGWFYDGEFVPDADIEGCNDPLDTTCGLSDHLAVSGGLGE